MTPYLVDTDVLLRWAGSGHPEHGLSVRAIRLLLEQGDNLFVAAQNIVEFWAVATRPADQRNGFGLSPAAAGVKVDAILNALPRLPDRDEAFIEWNALVRRYGVSGRPTHDARLAAVMRVYGIRHILTFDATGFSRYPDVTPVHPSGVTSSSGYPRRKKRPGKSGEVSLPSSLAPYAASGRARCAATSAVRNLIREGKTFQIPSIIETSTQQNMQTMDKALADLYRRGQISIDEALSRTLDRDAFKRLLNSGVY